MSDQEIRLECLRLASLAQVVDKSTTEIAQKYYDFVMGKEVWNATIEAAANVADYSHCNCGLDIRKLKK